MGTYVEWHYIDNFSTIRCQHFEGTGRTLWSVLVPSNALKGFPSVPYERGCFLRENTGFLINSYHKKEAAIDEYDGSNDGVFLPFFLSWLSCGACWLSGGGLPFALAPHFSGGVCCFELYWFWQSGAEDFFNSVDELRGQGSQRHWRRWETELCTGRTNQRRTKKKWGGQCLEVVVTRSVSCLLFTPMGILVSHYLVIFRLLIHHQKLLILPFLSLPEYTVFKSISRGRGKGGENTSSYRRRRLGMISRVGKLRWKSKQSWLLFICSWSPWNQELITHQSRTQP